MNTTVKHDEWLLEQLKDGEFAAEYLNAASEDDDSKTYLTALRKVVEARGGMTTIAEKAHLSRETLYRTLSTRGNPTMQNAQRRPQGDWPEVRRKRPLSPSVAGS